MTLLKVQTAFILPKYYLGQVYNFSVLYFLQATLESKTHEAEAKINIEKQGRMKAASVNDKLHAEKSELEEALSKGQTLITDMEAKVKNIEAEKKEVDRQVCCVTSVVCIT